MYRLFVDFLTKIFTQATYYIVHSWWLILFTLGCYLILEQSLVYTSSEYEKLQAVKVDLEYHKKQALVLQKKLTLEINSQSDPAWIELVLMKGLGLVKEGYTKVFFDTSKIEGNP